MNSRFESSERGEASQTLLADEPAPWHGRRRMYRVLFGVLVLAVVGTLAYVLVAGGSSDSSSTSAAGEDVPAEWYGHRFEVSNEIALCNDGSPAPFYVRQSITGSDEWLIFLDGGNACYSQETCDHRWNYENYRMVPRTTQEILMEELPGAGPNVLSADESVNPYWYSFNVAFISYCSSDSYLGTVTKDEAMERAGIPYHFQGANIVRGAFRDLFSDHGLADASVIVLAGISAGSFGLLGNGNFLYDMAQQAAPQAEMKGWLDSGWWLLNEPFRESYGESDCTTDSWTTCHIDDVQRLSKERFNTVHDADCEAVTGYTVECNFPEVLFPFIKFPLFVTQQQYDKLQLVGAGVADFDEQINEALDFTLYRGEEWRKSLAMNKYVWSSACRKHDIIDKQEMYTIKLNEFEETASEASIRWMQGEDVKVYDVYAYPDANPTCPER